MTKDNRGKEHTTDGREPTTPEGSTPQPINPSTGMASAYWVLSEEERKGKFVRPYRDVYKHVGIRPVYPIRDLTPAEKTRFEGSGFVAFEAYPPDTPEAGGGFTTGRFWTQKELTSGCGTVTTMGRSIAETYAKQPNFYGSTYCVHCKNHLPVGRDGEFEWLDGSKVGS